MKNLPNGFFHVYVVAIVSILALAGTAYLMINKNTNPTLDTPNNALTIETVPTSTQEIAKEQTKSDTADAKIYEATKPEPMVEETLDTEKNERDMRGSRAYGDIKFVSIECDKHFNKGTQLITENGLVFELLEDLNEPFCLGKNDRGGLDGSYDGYKDLLKRTHLPDATRTRVVAYESGRKYELEIDTILTVIGANSEDYFAFTTSTFVGGSEGGLGF